MASLDTCGGSQFQASTTITFSGTSLPTSLAASGDLIKASDQAGAKLSHQFLASNVNVRDGFLELTIPGGQKGKTVSSAEVATTFNVKYASVCTYAVLTNVSGSCTGMFFYQSDRQESDIEYISWPASTSNTNSPNGTRALQYTNQAKDGNPDHATMQYGALPSDATTAVHEYRLDWLPGITDYYVDGQKQISLTGNVPDQAGAWTWNNWNDGDPNWTGPPPTEDAIFKIQKIVMYYNLTDEATRSSNTSTTSGTSPAPSTNSSPTQGNDANGGAIRRFQLFMLAFVALSVIALLQ